MEMASEEEQCRFCLDTVGTEENPLIIPCECKGSIRFVHQLCLDKWRLVEPDRNGYICRLCDTVYMVPLSVMFEQIPNSTFWPFFLLRFPILLSFIAHYVCLIMMVTTISMTKQDFFIILDYSQLLFHLLFATLFMRMWSVQNKRLYFQRWLSFPTVTIPFIHVFFFVIYYENRLIGAISLSNFPMMYWAYHILFLHEINKQLQES